MQTAKLTGNLTVSLIIPVFNTKELVLKNLPEVLKAKENKANNIKEIIVIDDASTDGTYEAVKKNFPGIRLVRHAENRGFSSAVNMGARSAKGKLLALINSDVIPQTNFLVDVLAIFEDPNVFAISLNEKGYSWTKGTFDEGFIAHKESKQKKKIHETFWVSGGSGVYRRDYWMKLGGMDEKLLSPYYWEDIDLSYRAAKRGLINLWSPKGKVLHEHESSMNKINHKKLIRIRERNQLLFIWKNLTSRALFRKHLAGLTKRVVRHPGYLRIIALALFRLKLVLKARKKELRESKIADEAIFAKFKNS